MNKPILSVGWVQVEEKVRKYYDLGMKIVNYHYKPGHNISSSD